MTPSLPIEPKERGRRGGKSSRQKGDRFEREVVHLFQERGIGAERIPLSGSAGGSFAGDLTIPVAGKDQRFECKHHGASFKRLYEWLGANFGLFIRADRHPALVVLRAEDLAELIAKARPQQSDDDREAAFRRIVDEGAFDGLNGGVLKRGGKP